MDDKRVKPAKLKSGRRTPKADEPIAEFANPPVTEVVFGIGFEKLANYSSLLMGIFWNEVREEFPISEAKAPLPPPTGAMAMEFEISADTPPQTPRFFLRSEDRSFLIQLQEDRFLYNWIKVVGGPDYPRYSNMVNRFNSLWGLFSKFLNRERIDSPVIRELRLQYVNHITEGEGWDNLSEIQKVFPSYSFDERDDRYLKPPLSWVIVSSHDLPIENARMEISIKTGRYKHGMKDEKRLLAAELLVIGKVDDPKPNEVQQWFDMAREAIDLTFVEITSSQIQKNVWGMNGQ